MKVIVQNSVALMIPFKIITSQISCSFVLQSEQKLRGTRKISLFKVIKENQNKK